MIRQNQRLIHYVQMFVDVCMHMASFIATILFHKSIVITQILDSKNLLLTALTVSLISLSSYALFGLYKSYRSKRFLLEFYSIIKACIVSSVVIFAASFAFSVLNVWVILTYFAVNLTLSTIYRYFLRCFLRYCRARGYNKKYMLIIGVNKSTTSFIETVSTEKALGYQFIGYINNTVQAIKNIPYIGNFDQIDSYLEHNLVDEIVVMLDDYTTDQYKKIIERCEFWGVKFSLIPSFFSDFGSRLYISSFGGLPVFNIRQVPLDNQVNAVVKRLFDIVGATICIIILSPIMLVIALLIKLTSGGDVLYKQVRVGANRKEFLMYKFCSMKPQPTEKPKFATPNDDRCTPIGRVIRKCSIDELPQLINVLKGEMSLVGPRPEIPYFVDEFKQSVPLYMVKHYLRPGITGWAQVNGLRGDTSIPDRIKCDIYYIENWSFWFDIKILFMTVFKGIVNKNAY